jgi:hypothetical protein
MNNSKIRMTITVFITAIAIAYSQENPERFKLLNDEHSLIQINNIHIGFLGMGITYPEGGPVPIWLRSPNPNAPGDYFRHPAGADEMQLTETDIKEVESALNVAVSPRYYDSYIIDNLTGYEYELLEGKVSRREYYVKYGGGDTVYVISGLLGEFLSFYRAIPGEFRLSIDQLKAAAKELSPAAEFDDNDRFVEMENDQIYFVEYVDKDKMLRVRNYQVVKYAQDEAEAKEFPKGRYYNLIEITKFLDEEAMP